MAHRPLTDARQVPGSGASLPSTPSMRSRSKRIEGNGLPRVSEPDIDTSSSASDGKRKADDESQTLLGGFRRGVQVVRATLRFADAPPFAPGFKIGPTQLKNLMGQRGLNEVERQGGLSKISKKLKTSLRNGLDDDSEEALEKRRTGFGSNKLPSKPRKRFWMILAKASLKTSSLALIIFALASVAIQLLSKASDPKESWYGGAGILIALVIEILVKATFEYRKSVLLQIISEEKKNFQVEVIRKGLPCKISVFDIVVGDIVVISNGDQVPADGMLVSGQSTVDESWMTGRSVPVDKDPEKPFLLSECKVLAGYGTMLVLAVGVNTEWAHRVTSTLPQVGGDVLPPQAPPQVPRSTPPAEVHVEDTPHQIPVTTPSEVHVEDTPHQVPVTTPSEVHVEDTPHQVPVTTPSEVHGRGTPLQARLKALAEFLMRVGVGVDTLSFFALIIWYFTYDFDSDAWRIIYEIVYIITFLLSNGMVTSSEVLPGAVPLTVAYALRKIKAGNSMIRNSAACEKMGAVTMICSDKTGTVTLDQMTVVESWIVAKKSAVDGNLQWEGLQGISERVQATLFSGLCQNSCARVFVSDDGREAEVSGTPTEAAVLSWALQIGMNDDEIKKTTSAIHVEAFDSAKKRAGVIVKRTDGNMEAHWKGAPEVILEKSKKWVDEDGEVHSMTPEMSVSAKTYIKDMAAKSLRCIAFAYRPLTHAEVPDMEIPFDDLTFLCVIGIKNLCRPGVSDAVTRLRKAAQIKVCMVTGDSLYTAQAIAKECGILTNESNVAEGRIFCDPDVKTEELDRLLPTLEVLAVSSPSDKLRLVEELKKRGEVVAVTGRGTKDAPALRQADVGLAMGILGTEVAKQSSDIVILDDDFLSIVRVVPWGRSVHANIQKFIQFQLTLNFTILVISFVPAASTGKVPLSAVQLLWVDLIMDTFGALALATEDPTKDLMDAAPVGRGEPLITNVTWRNVFAQSVYQIAVLLTINIAGIKYVHGEDIYEREIRKNTIVFNAFVMCQVFNKVNSRRPEKINLFEGVFKNFAFVIVILSEVVVQIIIVELFGRFTPGFFTTKPLTWHQWLFCVAIGALGWPIALITKFIPLPEKPLVNPRKLKQKWRTIWRRMLPWGSQSKKTHRADVDVELGTRPQVDKPTVKPEDDPDGITLAQRTVAMESYQDNIRSDSKGRQDQDLDRDLDRMDFGSICSFL